MTLNIYFKLCEWKPSYTIYISISLHIVDNFDINMNTYGTSRDNLIFKTIKAPKYRLLIGANGILVVAVVGLVIALVVVSINNTRGSGDVSSEVQTDGQTERRITPVPKCPLNPGSQTPELDRAKCVLDSYPLIDGYAKKNLYLILFKIFFSKSPESRAGLPSSDCLLPVFSEFVSK